MSRDTLPILARGPPSLALYIRSIVRSIVVTKPVLFFGCFFLAIFQTVRYRTVVAFHYTLELLRYGAPVLAKSRGYADRTDGIAATPLDAADFDHPPSESVRRAAGALTAALAAFSFHYLAEWISGRGG